MKYQMKYITDEKGKPLVVNFTPAEVNKFEELKKQCLNSLARARENKVLTER